MSIVFDAHNHCFPPLGDDKFRNMAARREHQYHVRFHGQGIRRVRDDVRIEEKLLAGEQDGISWLPEVDFRVGRFGRLEFTHRSEDYYIQWMPPTLQDMSCSAEQTIAQMDYAGVDRAVLQHDRVYGRLDEFLSDCVSRYPNRLVALAQVDEWIGGQPDQIERLKHQITTLGFSGLYFSTGGFFHSDFTIGVNDPILEPLWKLIGDLDVPVHWYAATNRSQFVEAYLRELVELARWAESHPHIRCVLTHGLENIAFARGAQDRFKVPREFLVLLQRPNWSVELMLHIMHGDAEFSPHSTEVQGVVKTLVDELGVEKLMWGSDMPACERTVTYKQSMLLFQTQCHFLTHDQRAAILGENLARLYPIAR